MSTNTLILLVIFLILIFGGVGNWAPGGYGYGYGHNGIVGIILLCLLIFVVLRVLGLV